MQIERSDMHDDRNGLEPTLNDEQEVSGLEPTLRPRQLNLEGVHLTFIARMAFPEAITAVFPTPHANRPVLAFGNGPYRYETVDLKSGHCQAVALPSDLALAALDGNGQFYLLDDGCRTLNRYTVEFKEDLRIDLRGTRSVTVGSDGHIYTWWFSSREMEVYDSTGQLLRVLDHGHCPYSLAVDDRNVIWLGEASFSHVVEISPLTGEILSYIDPKEDFTAENLFCYTYAMTVDRWGNLWTFNGQGDVGDTIINPDKTQYLRFASKDVGSEYERSEPHPSPWNDEVYFVSNDNVLTSFQSALLDWKAITPDIHDQNRPR